MAAYTNSYNSIHACAKSAQCTSNLVLAVLDAANILVVSVVVCLRVIMLLA